MDYTISLLSTIFFLLAISWIEHYIDYYRIHCAGIGMCVCQNACVRATDITRYACVQKSVLDENTLKHYTYR